MTWEGKRILEKRKGVSQENMFGVPLNNAGPARKKRSYFVQGTVRKRVWSQPVAHAPGLTLHKRSAAPKKFSNQQPSDAGMPGSFELAPWKARF